MALTFSSTIIIVNLLSDKREIDSLHGRIAVGFLIVQDLLVVLVMIALTAFGAGRRSGEWTEQILLVALQGIGLLVVSALLMRYVIPRIFRRAARSIELLTAVSIAWAVGCDWRPARGFDVIVFGLGRFGNQIARGLAERGQRVLGVDFDPDLVYRLRESGRSVVYGDAEDPEFASMLPLGAARWVVSSVPQLSVNLALLEALARHRFSGRTATTAHTEGDAAREAVDE